MEEISVPVGAEKRNGMPLYLGVPLALLLTVLTLGLSYLFYENYLNTTPPSQGTPGYTENLPWYPMKVGTQTFYVQIPITSKQQAVGLSHRKSLANNHGMLFPFNPASVTSFWMKNMLFPLDLIYIKNNKIVGIERNISPCSGVFCPMYSSGSEVDYVLEVKGKHAKELGIKVGDTVEPPYVI